MAISNYTELQTAVANWLDRDDLTNRIPEFISLCEARFNRTLRLRAMETLDTSVSTVAGNSITIGLCSNERVSFDNIPFNSIAILDPRNDG